MHDGGRAVDLPVAGALVFADRRGEVGVGLQVDLPVTQGPGRLLDMAAPPPPPGPAHRGPLLAPTPSSQGFPEHTCSRCGDSYRDNYTDKLKEVFDLQAVIDYGNAYAQSLGFTIDRSMTLANSSYYPGYYGGGYSLDFLKERVVGNVQYTAEMLIADGDTIPGFRCNIHASYEPETDKYYIVVLYG